MVPLATNLSKHNHTTVSQAFSSHQYQQGMVQPNFEVTYRLIDSILPFEACLYHQVLPLSLEGTHLNLGMVNQEDAAALDYVRRILAYMNCSLVPRQISATQHQEVLSAYLNYMGQQKQAANEQQNSPSKETVNQQLQSTLIVDRPEYLQKTEIQPKTGYVMSGPTTYIQSDQELPESTSKGKLTKSAANNQIAPVPPTTLSLPVLDVKPQHLSTPVEVLATLPPKSLLNELLARVLAGGIGRLYFERHPDRGRILWSQNGILQSVLDGLSTTVFQGVINELKRLTHLSLIAVEQPKQVEIERVYQNHRLLLRLRVMPGTNGEEATLQVLRGAALKFYQQQQLENLSRDALTIAQQLQIKINEIQKRTRIDPTLTTGQLEAIPALDQLLKSLNKQLENLKLQQAEQNENNSDMD